MWCFPGARRGGPVRFCLDERLLGARRGRSSHRYGSVEWVLAQPRVEVEPQTVDPVALAGVVALCAGGLAFFHG